jgi:hypothetical protein
MNDTFVIGRPKWRSLVASGDRADEGQRRLEELYLTFFAASPDAEKAGWRCWRGGEAAEAPSKISHGVRQ